MSDEPNESIESVELPRSDPPKSRGWGTGVVLLVVTLVGGLARHADDLARSVRHVGVRHADDAGEVVGRNHDALPARGLDPSGVQRLASDTAAEADDAAPDPESLEHLRTVLDLAERGGSAASELTPEDVVRPTLAESDERQVVPGGEDVIRFDLVIANLEESYEVEDDGFYYQTGTRSESKTTISINGKELYSDREVHTELPDRDLTVRGTVRPVRPSPADESEFRRSHPAYWAAFELSGVAD